MELKDKIVIVTGGAGGIGEVLVNQLIDEGAIIGVFDVNPRALKRLQDTHRGLYCAQCDLSEARKVESAVEDFFQIHGKIDALVNNAAIIHNEMLVGFGPQGMLKHGIDTWDRVISTNLSSVFYVTLYVVEKMIAKRTKGVVVNVSSITSCGNAGQSAYAAAKAGVRALAVTWAKELCSLGIRVAGIAPGYTETETTKTSMSEAVKKDWIKKTPLRRMAKPEEIVDGILFILKNDYFNGRTLEVDGGLRM